MLGDRAGRESDYFEYKILNLNFYIQSFKYITTERKVL